MSWNKILSQKIKHPRTQEWIEINYVAEDVENDVEPVIYMHGSLADSNIIESRHIQEGAVGASQLSLNSITTDHIVDSNVTDRKIANLSVNTNKIANGAVTKNKIDWTTIFTVTTISGSDETHDRVVKLKIGA